jgi:2-phosphosulfolactate phosphatase
LPPVRVNVAFTPAEPTAAPVAIVVDVMRATSTIAVALASGYPRVYVAPGIKEARATRERLGEGLLGGERNALKIEGFDVGASPREFQEGRDVPLIFSTTNGTQAILAAAERAQTVLLGSLLNLSAVARAAAETGEDVTVVCAGFQRRFALDDAYCAGRIVSALGGEHGDGAKAAALIAAEYPDPVAGISARTYGPPGLEDDLAFVARVDVLETVPRLVRMLGPAAEIAG